MRHPSSRLSAIAASAGSEAGFWLVIVAVPVRPPPYQACSRDAFKLVERETSSSRLREVDRGCPLGTVRARLMWHASGTAGEDTPVGPRSRGASIGGR